MKIADAEGLLGLHSKASPSPGRRAEDQGGCAQAPEPSSSGAGRVAAEQSDSTLQAEWGQCKGMNHGSRMEQPGATQGQMHLTQKPCNHNHLAHLSPLKSSGGRLQLIGDRLIRTEILRFAVIGLLMWSSSARAQCGGIGTPGAFGRSEYLYCATIENRDGADADCATIAPGWALTRVDDSGENAFIDVLGGGNNVWIGGDDLAVEGQWRWPDGDQFGRATPREHPSADSTPTGHPANPAAARTKIAPGKPMAAFGRSENAPTTTATCVKGLPSVAMASRALERNATTPTRPVAMAAARRARSKGPHRAATV